MYHALEKIEVAVTPPNDGPVQNGTAVGAAEVAYFFHFSLPFPNVFMLGPVFKYRRCASQS